MQDKNVRTFGDLSVDEMEAVRKLFVLGCAIIQTEYKIQVSKIQIEDSGGTFCVEVILNDPEGGEPDA